jgi:diguanylate cyclase (GGDEF)-like protein/PAS domain S-box-containing protein
VSSLQSSLRLLAPALAGLIATLICLAISVMLARLDLARERAGAESRVLAQMALVQSRLATVLRGTFSPTDSLVHLVASQGGVSDEIFSAIGERLIAQTPTIRNLVIAPGDRVAQIFPLAGNEAAMNLHYPSIPAQYATVLKAKEKRSPVMAGPVALIQGGYGFIQRYPVFVKDANQSEERYWGVISIVADVNKVLEAGGVKTASELNLSIVSDNGTTVFGDKNTGGDLPVTLNMDIPGGAWELRAAPKDGWPSTSLFSSNYLLFGLINSLLVGFLSWLLLRRQQTLKEQFTTLTATLTAKQQSEAAAEKSQRLLQAIMNSAPTLIYVFDREGRLLFCNQQFEKAVGHSRESMIGTLRTDFLPAAIAEQHHNNDQSVLANGQALSIEESNQENDGEHTYLTLKSALRDADGEINAVIGVSTDITSRKKAEKDLQLASTIFANTADGIIVTDPAGTIVLTNPAFTQITGYSAAEAQGKNPRILQSDHQDAGFYRTMWQALGSVGLWQGEIWNRRKNGELFPEWLSITTVLDPCGAVSNYVGVFSDISAIKRSQAELEHLAHFDPLTELPNRSLFHDRLSHALERAGRYNQHVAVMVLDLDGFKTVNDSLGHPIGDQLLQQVAHRLKDCVRVEDTVARLGGDEFSVVLANLKSGDNIVDIARKILDSIERPFSINGHAAMVSTSIGIAVFPEDGTTPDLLIRNADAAMYQSKAAGRNTYHYYQPEMTQAAQRRLASEQALRRAIERQEFEVWYQPQLNLATGGLIGAEALVRWRDPERGLIPPNEFIPLAESTGMIIPIGEQVLRQVCQDITKWQTSNLNPGKVGVNVAGPQLFRSDFIGLLCDVIEKFAIPPSALEIEITETCVLDNPELARQLLDTIQDMGISIAIDDFGTGYSSLSHLKKLPIDTLKIDRSFVSDLPDHPHDIAITRAILAMGRSLGFDVIAEGVETKEQQKFLLDEGCIQGQGYLFAKPMPFTEFTYWLQARYATTPEIPPAVNGPL